MSKIEVKLIILYCIKLYFVKCSSLFQLYDKSTDGLVYVVSSDFKMHIAPTHSVRLRKDNQLYVEFLDVYYDLEKIRGYNVYYFNGTNLTIGEKNNLRIGEIRIDFKKKTLNKINIRANSTLVNQLQFCWISQLNFSSSCSSAVGGTGGTIYTFYYDTEFKQFQIEYLIVFNVWHNDNVQFIFNQLNF
ncbi:unnamed protein product [Brachionus calyciflorus]|uniref:Uncharacterized protein n=1 Tax=Brachionus calyciflorus TaxID=104777 RepID=A0A814D6Q9_9BILA|nr:unnamed protein product [Brachionus calyciflorus]